MRLARKRRHSFYLQVSYQTWPQQKYTVSGAFRIPEWGHLYKNCLTAMVTVLFEFLQHLYIAIGVIAARVTWVQTLPIFALQAVQGSINALDPCSNCYTVTTGGRGREERKGRTPSISEVRWCPCTLPTTTSSDYRLVKLYDGQTDGLDDTY